MPIFNIHFTEGLSPQKQKIMYNKVSKVIAEVQGCPIEAVSGYLQPMKLYQMGSGEETWEEKIEKNT